MDRLVGPLLGVFVFWWAALYVWAAPPDSGLAGLLEYLRRALLALLAGGLFGLLMAHVARRQVVLQSTLQRLHGVRRDMQGARVSIGRLPALPQPRMSPAPKGVDWVPPDLRAWWDWYRQAHPEYARALQQAWRVMHAANLPASPQPGGHGGATLVEHAWNVLRTLLRLKAWPEYTGVRTSEGRLVFDLLDAQRRPYRFDRRDPLPMLCAFAHDIGKAACYRRDGARVIEVRDHHDTEGARLLRTLQAWRELQPQELQRALICVGYYHKPLQMPLVQWIDDRARALSLLIQHIDALTGRLEGQGYYAAYIAQPAAPVAPPLQTHYAAQALDASLEETHPAQALPDEPRGAHEDHEAQTEPPPDAPASDEADDAERAVRPPSASATVLADISDEEIIDLTASVLLKHDALSGRRSAHRVGYKYGSWVYLLDPLLNERMRDHCASMPGCPLQPQHFERQHPGVPTAYARRLMVALANQGALKQEHEGRYWGEASSFFLLQDAQGKPVGPYCIVARAYAFGRAVFDLPDCPREPAVARAVRHNDALTDEAHIERIRQRLAAWREPVSAQQRKQEAARQRAGQEQRAMQQAGVQRMPFTREAVALLTPQELTEALVRDEAGQACYRASIVQRRFAEPPHGSADLVEIDGEPCWRFAPVRKGA